MTDSQKETENDEEIPEVPGRSFLTKSQREYLFGKDFSKERERQLRFQIRKNLQSALMDLQLIWNLSERDRFLAFKPLSGFYGMSSVADWVMERDGESMQTFSDDFSDTDTEIGGLMHEGITDLLTLYADYYGPQAVEYSVQYALNQASFRQALEREQDIGGYEIQIEHVESIKELNEDLD